LVGSIPASIGKLEKLEILGLAGNQLTGMWASPVMYPNNLLRMAGTLSDIPWQNMTPLEVLTLGTNDFTGL